MPPTPPPTVATGCRDNDNDEDASSSSHSSSQQQLPSKKRPALTSITNQNNNIITTTNHNNYEAEAVAPGEWNTRSSSTGSSSEFHAGRYAKLRRTAVLASTVKPPFQSLGWNSTGIQILEDWNELVDLYTIKLQQQQDAKARKEQLKQQQQQQQAVLNPAKKKKKPNSLPVAQVPMKPALPPNPRTILPGIQLRTHLHFQKKVALEDEGIDFSPPIPVGQHQLFLFQFLHYIMEKAKSPSERRSYHPLLKRLFPLSSAARKILDASPVPSNHDPFHNAMDPDRFASRISIHNPVAVAHLVVLELHVRTQNDAVSLVQAILGTAQPPLPKQPRKPQPRVGPSLSINKELPAPVPPPPTVIGTNHHPHNSNVVVLPTTWYNTDTTEPLSMTDRFMYHHHHEWKLKCHRQKPGAFTIGFIYDQLKPFVLSKEQWEKEEYPPLLLHVVPPTTKIPHHSNDKWSAVVNDKIQNDWQKSRDGQRFLRGISPQSRARMEWKEARQFIQPYYAITGSSTADETAADIDDDKDNITNHAVLQQQRLPFVGHAGHSGLMMDQHLKIPPEPPARDFFWEYDDFDDSPPKTRRIFAMDCDLVVTTEMGDPPKVARMTLCEMVFFDQVANTASVETHRHVHLDVVVIPPNCNNNHCSDVVVAHDWNCSGTMADMLYHGERMLRLEQVQAALLQLIHPCDIVIGHSLAPQFHALRFVHPTVVDTALMFHDDEDDEEKQHSLRHLAAVLLQREIQRPDRTHCCSKGAATAMELAVKRAIYGPSFCINNTKSNWFTKLPHQLKNPITAVAVGPSEWLRQHVLSPSSSSSNATQALTCESIDDSNSQAIAGWVAGGPTRRASVVWSKMDLSESSSNDELTRLNEFVHDVITKLSSHNSVLLMIPIQINYSDMKELHEQRQIRRDDPSATTVPWSKADETQYQTCREECRNGYVLYITAKG